MSKIGCREVYFVNAMRPNQIDFLIDKVKDALKEMRIPPKYDIRVYRNVYSCCGIGGLGLIIEVVGPEEEKIRAIDLRAVARVLEFCEKEGLEVGHHTFENLDVI